MKEIRDTLATGALWKFLSLLFRCPGDVPVGSIGTLAGELPDGLQAHAREILSLIEDSQLEGAYHALLGSGGPVSPYESDYQGPGQEGMRDKGVVLGDVAAFYKAFGFDHSKEMLEVPDHVSLEMAFVSYLKLKEAYARMDAAEDAYRICREAENKFLSEHLLGWLPQFLERVIQHGTHEFYEKTACLLGDFLLMETIQSENTLG